MKKAIVISLVALLLNSAGVFVFAQTLPRATEKDFTAAYDAQVRKTLATFPDLPGIAIVVIKDDKPIFVRAYGMADKEAGIKADTDTLFYIASSTKSFTALAAAMLDKEGKIKFSDPVTKYTPGIRFKNCHTGQDHDPRSLDAHQRPAERRARQPPRLYGPDRPA